MIDDEYSKGYEDGYVAAVVNSLPVEHLLDLALGEATRLADEIDVLKKQLDLATTDDLE